MGACEVGLRRTRSVPGVLGGAVAMPQEVANSSFWGAPKWCITARSASVDPVRPEVVVQVHGSVASVQWQVGFAAVPF